MIRELAADGLGGLSHQLHLIERLHGREPRGPPLVQDGTALQSCHFEPRSA